MYNKKYVLGQPIMYNLLIFYTNCSVKLSKSQLERISAFYKITVWNSLIGYSHDSRDIRLLWPVRLCPAPQKFWPLADCRRPGPPGSGLPPLLLRHSSMGCEPPEASRKPRLEGPSSSGNPPATALRQRRRPACSPGH